MLLITPLVSSTCSLWYAWDQSFFLTLFTKDPVRTKTANEILPGYIQNFFKGGLPSVVSLIGVTFWSSLGSIYFAGPVLETRGSLRWYALSAALAVGHLGFIPGVAWKLTAMMDDTCEDEGTDQVGMVKRWCGVNQVRMLTADLGCWLCAVVAVSTTFSV